MAPGAFDAELEQRLEMIENAKKAMILPDLPVLDVVAAAVGLAVGSTALLWWCL